MAKIDRFQRQAIDASLNSVVSAGAGSGKTTVLSERFTDLVLNRGCEVDQILTLTFTKKATVEMSSRIYRVLKEKAPEKAKDFYKANIKTLDSYCNSVAKMGCNRYGISPDFTQDEQVILSKINGMALPFILEHRDNYAIKALVNTKDYAEIAKELFVTPMIKVSTVSSPIDFEAGFRSQQEEIIQAWKKASEKADDYIHALGAAYDNFAGNRQTKLLIAIAGVLEKEDGNTPDIPDLTFEDIENADSSAIEDYSLYFSKFSSLSLQGAGKGTEEIKEVVKAMRDHIGTLIAICNYVSGYSLTKELLPLLIEFQEKVNQVKRNSGILTFRDISNLATCILRDCPDIRQIEKEKYKAIMIDEFQDNNQQQRDMLFMLAEKLDRHETGIPEVQDLCPDKLFFVGDEKQSIYRFRDADVSVFRALSNDFRDGNLSMSTNYRSHPSLIKAFNIMFGEKPSVFYTEEDEEQGELPNYEAIYHKVTTPEAKLEEAEKNPEVYYKPHVHIARYNTEQECERNSIVEEEAEANWIAEKIQKLCTEGINGEVYQPHQIAILLRNYSLQPLYERTLLNYGIPYNTEVVTGFFADGPVNDIFSFLRICVYENDTISYAQVLRSPFVNLTVTDANAVILSKEKPFEGKATEYLSDEGLKNYLHAKAFFDEFKESAKTEPLTKSVTKLWYNGGYRFETLWNKKVSMYTKMYDLIFELAHQSEQANMSLSAFVDSMRDYHDQSAKLENMDIPMERAQGVHILTIHKSKGLEYDVVFVCGTHKKGANDTNASPVYSSKTFGLTLNTPPCKSFSNSKSNYFYDLVHDENKKMENAELRRLVYVAVTRAAKELYITNGKYKPAKEPGKYLPGGSGNLDTIYHTIEPVLSYYEDPDYQGYKFFDTEDIPVYDYQEVGLHNNADTGRRNTFEDRKLLLQALEEMEAYEKAEVIKKDEVPEKYASPSQLHPTDDETGNLSTSAVTPADVPFSEINKIIIASIPKKDGKTVDGAEPRFGFTNFGTIAHAYMEAVITGEEAKYSNRDIVGLENPDKDLATIIKVCTEMQEKFKASELGKAATNSKWHKPEYDFRSKIGNKIIKGIVDLVFQNEDGTYTIVDYKTNQQIEPELYYNQLACYRQAIAQMRNIKEPDKINCWLYYLRFGQAVNITEECNQVCLEEVIENLDTSN